MNLSSIIVASILLSILSTSAYFSSASIYSVLYKQKNMTVYTEVQKAIVNFYDRNGDVPSSLKDLPEYVINHGTINNLVDSYGNPYQIFRRSVNDTPIAYDNLSDIRFIVVSVGINKTLDSKLNNNVFEPNNNEDFVIINDELLLKGRRGRTKNNVEKCDTAYDLYLSATGETANNVVELVANEYLKGFEAQDAWNVLLNLDSENGKCYSSGPNKVNDSNSGDDIQ